MIYRGWGRMSKVAEKVMVPRLRFPEFRDKDDWRPLTLNEVCQRITGKVGERRLTTVSITAGVGFVSQAEKFSRDISGKQYKNYIVLKQGEFSYNKGNSKKFPQGCIYKLKEFDEVAAPSAFLSFRFKGGYVADFFPGYFDNNYHGRQLLRFITSGARSDGLLNISPADFFSIILPTPVDKSEQKKIADCLASIDALVTAQTQKLDQLKAHKKGLMQQLFPQPGETIPRLRFPEFHGSWEKIDLGSIGKVSMCKRVLKDQTLPQGEVPFYKIGTFGKKADAFISRQLFEKYKEQYSYPNLRDILISASGTIGRLVVFDGKDAYFQDSNIVWIDNHESLVKNSFLRYCYEKIIWQTDDNIIARLYNDNLRRMSIVIPTRPEQQKIANALSSIDALITAQSQKIEHLKSHKKGLMQQLFPSADEVDA